MIRLAVLASVMVMTGLHAHGEDVKFKKDPAQPDLYKAMEIGHIARPIAALIRSERVPHWVKGIGKNRNYVTAPGLLVEAPLPGALVLKACETADCAERFEVIVTPHENHAFGLLMEGKNMRFIGHPKEKSEAVLKAAITQ